jgi:transcriptional regulator with XRE-family HTH domain
MRATKEKPWRYTDCGLDNIWLVGIRVETDPATDEEEPVIPQLRDLHDCIFVTLLEKSGHLTGREVRFLRRHLGWTQAAASGKLGFNSPQYFSEIERRKTAFSDIPVDFVWRLLCTNALAEKTKGARRKQAQQIKTNLLQKTENLLARMRDRNVAAAIQIAHARSNGLPRWKPLLRAA